MARTKQSIKQAKEVKPSTRAAAARSTTKKVPLPAGIRRPHRFRPGTAALMQIRKLQNSSESLIPYAPFLRLVREIINDLQSQTPEMRVRENVPLLLREAAEARIIELMGYSQLSCIHAKRVTVSAKDMQFAVNLLRMEGVKDLEKAGSAKEDAGLIPMPPARRKSVPQKRIVDVAERTSTAEEKATNAWRKAKAAIAAAKGEAAAVEEPEGAGDLE